MSSPLHRAIKKICFTGLVKEIVIENEELITSDGFYLGIMIPTFNRPEYLKYTLFSLARSDLDVCKIAVVIFDDGSEEYTENLIRKFTIEGVPIIKIFINRLKLVTQNEYTILPGSAFPLTIRYGCEILFHIGAYYVMNTDSDTMFTKNWLSILTRALRHIVEEHFILAGFRCADSFHRVIHEGDVMGQLASFGGANYTCNRPTFFNFLKDHINDYAFDWALSAVCNQNHLPIYLTKPSLVQHIGVHSSIIRGSNNMLAKCYETTEDEITFDKMQELDTAVKQLPHFPFALDFKLE